MGGRRDQRERKDAPEVVDQDEGEERDQERQVAPEVVPDHVPGDAVADEEVGGLADELSLARHQAVLASHDHPEEDDQDHRDDRHHEVLVEPRQRLEQRGSSKLSTPGASKPSVSSPPVSNGVRPKITPLTSPSCRSHRFAWEFSLHHANPTEGHRHAESADDHVAAESGAEHDPDRQQEAGAQRPIAEPAQEPVERDPGDQVGQHSHAEVHAVQLLHLERSRLLLHRVTVSVHGGCNASSPQRLGHGSDTLPTGGVYSVS